MTLIRCTVSRDIWHIFYGVCLVTHTHTCTQLKTRTHLTDGVASDYIIYVVLCCRVQSSTVLLMQHAVTHLQSRTVPEGD